MQPISILSGLISGFSIFLQINVYKQYFITAELWLSWDLSAVFLYLQ